MIQPQSPSPFGSTFDSFLEEQGIKTEITDAIKKRRIRQLILGDGKGGGIPPYYELPIQCFQDGYTGFKDHRMNELKLLILDLIRDPENPDN